MTSTKISDFSYYTLPPLSVTVSCNLPFFGQTLVNSCSLIPSSAPSVQCRRRLNIAPNSKQNNAVLSKHSWETF